MRKVFALTALMTLPALASAHPGEHGGMGIVDGILHHAGHPLTLAVGGLLIGVMLLGARRRARNGTLETHSSDHPDHKGQS